MPYSWNRPPVPIDKTKRGQNYDASAFTNFVKIGTISGISATNNSSNMLTDVNEQIRSQLLISGLTTINSASCLCPTTGPMSIVDTQLNNTPPGKIILTAMTYISPGGDINNNAFPGILATSQTYGANFYYFYLTCTPDAWINDGNGMFTNSNFNTAISWCDIANAGQVIYEKNGVPASHLTFTDSNFQTPQTITYPTDSKLWFVGNYDASGTYNQVDYVNNAPTGIPGRSAGSFLLNSFFLSISSKYYVNPAATASNYSITLPTPAFYV